MTSRLLATLALALVCCSSPIDSDGADETSGGAAFDASCRTEDEATVTCSGGQCWATHPTWGCAAPVLLPGAADGLEKAKVVAGSDCWFLPGTDGAHMCTISLGCVTLVGRPLIEVGALGQPCSAGSVWDETGSLGVECVVVYDALALQCL